MHYRVPRVQIVSFEGLSDASGAPAIITCDGWTFAFDVLGEIKCNLLTRASGRKPSRSAVELATAKYRETLSNLGLSWHDRNRAIYDQPARKPGQDVLW